MLTSKQHKLYPCAGTENRLSRASCKASGSKSPGPWRNSSSGYWVLVKLLFTVFAAIVLLLKMDLINCAARLATETTLSHADLHEAEIQLVVHAAGGLLVLLTPMALLIYKPQGMTRYGWRKQFEQQPSW